MDQLAQRDTDSIEKSKRLEVVETRLGQLSESLEGLRSVTETRITASLPPLVTNARPRTALRSELDSDEPCLPDTAQSEVDRDRDSLDPKDAVEELIKVLKDSGSRDMETLWKHTQTLADVVSRECSQRASSVTSVRSEMQSGFSAIESTLAVYHSAIVSLKRERRRSTDSPDFEIDQEGGEGAKRPRSAKAGLESDRALLSESTGRRPRGIGSKKPLVVVRKKVHHRSTLAPTRVYSSPPHSG